MPTAPWLQADPSCEWCEDKAPGSSENPYCADPSEPPKAGYICGNATNNACEPADSNTTCQQIPGCQWCTSHTVGPLCGGYGPTHKLPPSIFTCYGPY